MMVNWFFRLAELTSWKSGCEDASSTTQYDAAVYVVPISIEMMSFPSNSVLSVGGMSRKMNRKKAGRVFMGEKRFDEWSPVTSSGAI